MSRYRSVGAHGHSIRMVNADHFWISWTVDRYYPDSRLRHPRTTKKATDAEGAARFAKKHKITLPASPSERS